MNQTPWKNKIRSLVDIKRDEISQTSLMFAYNFLIIASHIIVKSLRDALFIHQVGADKLPYVYIGIAIVAGIVMQGYARLARAVRRKQLIIGINLFFIVNVMIFWWLFQYEWLWLSYALYIWAGIFSAVSIVQFWLIANDIFNPRQAKRLFGFILSGGTLGGILAGVVSRGIVNIIGTENLFLVVVAQLLGCAIIMRQITFQESAPLSSESARVSARSQDGESAFASIRKNKHLVLLAMIISVTVLATTLVDFQFKNIIQRSYETKDALTGFFGSYYAYINILTVLFQILVTGRVLKRFGVGVAILIMPAGLFLGSLSVLIYPILWAAVFAKACDDVFSLSVNKWGTEILYIPIPASVKLKTKTFIDVVVERISRGVAGLLLLFLTLVISLDFRQLSIPTVIFLMAWILLCILIYREYIVSIEATLQKRSLDADTLTVDLSDSSTINQLLPLLDSKNKRKILYALELLQGVTNPEIIERVQKLCHHPSPEVRVQALRMLFSIGIPELTPKIETLLEDEDEEVRTEAIHYVSAYGKTPSTEKLGNFLQSPDYKMKIAAISCITRYGNAGERELLTQNLIEQMLSERGPQRKLVLLGAAKALGVMERNSTLEEHLLSLFNDGDIDVVRQAISSAGITQNADLVPYLVEKLGDSATRVSAREALASYGPEILEALMSVMTNEESPMSIRRQIPKVISMMSHQEAANVLLNHLSQKEMDLRYKIIRALAELRGVQAGIKFNTNLVKSHVIEGIRDYYRLSIILAAQDDSSSRLLYRALRERLELFEEVIFRLLGLIYPPESMYNAYRGVTSYNTRIQANAVELLDNILSRDIKRMLFPIIDNSSKAAFMEQASALWAMQSMEEKEAMTKLIDGNDTWLKACTIHTIGENGVRELREYVKQACGSPDPLIRESAESAWRKLRTPST